MSRNPDRGHVASLVAGAAAGHYTLPAAIEVAVRAEAKVRAQLAEARRKRAEVNADGIAGELESAVLVAAQDDAALPGDWVAPLFAAGEATRRLDAEVLILSTVADRALEQTVVAGHETADELVTDHLRPQLEELLTKVRRYEKIAPSVPWDDPARAVGGPKDIQTAYAEVRKLADHYDALRNAQRTAYLLQGGENDATQRFSAIRNMLEVWPSIARRGQGVPPPPWPANRLARLVWLATSKAETWMPTKTEAEAVWMGFVNRATRAATGSPPVHWAAPEPEPRVVKTTL